MKMEWSMSGGGGGGVAMERFSPLLPENEGVHYLEGNW